VSVACGELDRGERNTYSAEELELLRFLIAHRGEVVSRDTLLAEVWGHPQDIVTRTVDNFIVRLRKKIRARSGAPALSTHRPWQRL
jgi:DNA-binding response OmpR family regulator